MTISNSWLHLLKSLHENRVGHMALVITAWSIGSGVTAEVLGYWLHRLMHSGWIGFLSRSHMEHHMVHYGPIRKQRTTKYHDATGERLAFGNIGLEWLAPAAFVFTIAVVTFRCFHVHLLYQAIGLGITLGWSFLMFSYLHDVMHIEGFWLERNRVLKLWFLSARRLHEIHHRVLNDRGLMDKNFGIGFFVFDRLFGTLALRQPPFNHRGYAVAREKFAYFDTSSPKAAAGLGSRSAVVSPANCTGRKTVADTDRSFDNTLTNSELRN